MTSMFPTVTNTSALAAALASSQVSEPQAGGGAQFIRFDFEDGSFTFGRDQDDISGCEFLVNTPSIKHGWVLWSAKRAHKTMVAFTQELPMPPASIGDDHPSKARGLEGALFDDGTPLVFDTNSEGGRGAVDTLLGAIKAKAAMGGQHLFPLVTLDSESYANKHRGGKLVFNPVFNIVSWHNEDGVAEVGAAPAVTDQTAAMATEVPGASPADEPEAPPAPVEPVRRRRRDTA